MLSGVRSQVHHAIVQAIEQKTGNHAWQPCGQCRVFQSFQSCCQPCLSRKWARMVGIRQQFRQKCRNMRAVSPGKKRRHYRVESKKQLVVSVWSNAGNVTLQPCGQVELFPLDGQRCLRRKWTVREDKRTRGREPLRQVSLWIFFW